MGKYRKKETIEAFRMTKERRWDRSEWPEWLHTAWNRGPDDNGLWPDRDMPNAPGHESASNLLCGWGAYKIVFGD